MDVFEELKRITETLGRFPRHADLVKLKEFKVRNYIINSKIKISEYAEFIGQKTARPKDYWTEENILKECKKICDECGGWPTKYVWNDNFSYMKSVLMKNKINLKTLRLKIGVTKSMNVNSTACKHCKKEFTPDVAKNSSRQKFCSDHCREEFFRLRQNTRIAERRNKQKVCPICSKAFIPSQSIKQKYCERKCFTRFRKKMDKAVRRCLESLGESKECRSSEILGYTPQELLQHLKSFPTWDQLKQRKWELDHIFPVKAFIDRGIRDIKLICCLENLQPLSRKDNLNKADKFNVLEFEEWLIKKGV